MEVNLHGSIKDYKLKGDEDELKVTISSISDISKLRQIMRTEDEVDVTIRSAQSTLGEE